MYERLRVYVREQQESRRGNRSHSFRSIRFSVSQSVRPLTGTLGFSNGTLRVFNIQAETGAGLRFLGRGEH